PPRLADAFELAVAVMLLLLGARALYRALRPPADEPHRHGHEGLIARPLVVGVVHGLAGSGAVTALVLAQLPDTASRIIYTVLFGLGSMAGMAGLSTVAGFALRRQRNDRLRRGILASVGVLSATLGVVWGLPILSRLA